VDTRTTTTSSGDYTIPYLKAGEYSVSAEANGFERELHTGIILQVAQTATVNFVLKIGHVTETVTVRSDPIIDFAKADAGEVVENTRVTELPLNGRDPGMLSVLMAGVNWNQSSTQYQRPFDDTQANLSVNGGGSGNTALMLDGVSNEASSLNNTGNAHIAYVPPVDSVQEFKIITNPFDAQYGRLAGGVEDVVLKSGTNRLHGDIYEYARRTFLDANTWKNKYSIATALPGTDLTPYQTDKHKLDQYGFELDGPVRIPKLYNGRDKSFFTMQYENWNETEPNTLSVSVPDPAWLKGDFRSLVTSDGKPISILDPENISQNANGTWVRIPFGPTDTINPTPAANMIPASRLNAMAVKMLSFYPAPNTQTQPGSNPFANNYTVAAPDTDRYRNVLGKWDQNLSSKDRFSMHYGYWERVEIRNTNGLSGAPENGLFPHGERSHTFTLEETHTVNPDLLIDFRANVAVRADFTQGGPTYDPTALGWTPAQTAAMGPSAQAEFPYLNISEFASMGTTGNSQTVSNSLALFPSVTWVKNRHTIHAGLDARFQQSGDNIVGGGNNFWIDRTWTQTNCGSCGSWDTYSGNSIASLLLGNPTSGTDTINVKTFWSGHYWAPFIQDDWKVSKKLTLNLGVRWDFMPAETERNNYGNYAFDKTAVNPINSQVNVPGYGQVLGGVTFLGVNGNPRGGYALTKANIQPRVGFAYAVNDRMVLRGGFGESMKSPQNAPLTYGFSSTTNYQANDPTRPGSTYPNLANPINNPYSSVIQPTGSSLGLLQQLGQSIGFLNSHYQIPSFWNYSLGIEQQFMQHDTLSISYVGSRLYNGDSSDNVNHENAAAYMSCNPVLGGRPEVCSNNNVANPFIGVNGFQGTSYYNSSTVNALNFTRPFPEFGDTTEWQENDARTWYNSLQVTGIHRWSNSLTMHGTWTWSKLMDAGGWTDETYRVPSRSLDGNDRTHRITLSGVYLLPVGRKRTFLGNTNRIVDGVIGGWELGSLYIYQTGTPWGVPSPQTWNIIGRPYVHPYIQKDNGFIRLAAPCVEQYQENINGVYNPVFLDPVATYDYKGACPGANFLQIPNYGETANIVYTGIRIPRSQQLDVNLSKNFALVARATLQLRLEAFNALNHPLFSESPDGNMQDATFGVIQKGNGQSNLPRQVQLSAKIVW
jgi:hypothetical protein